MMFFSDASKATPRRTMIAFDLLFALPFLVVVGFPIKWEKTHGGIEFDYVRYWEGWEAFSGGINQQRADWLRSWVAHLLVQRRVEVPELQEVLGGWNRRADIRVCQAFLGADLRLGSGDPCPHLFSWCQL